MGEAFPTTLGEMLICGNVRLVVRSVPGPGKVAKAPLAVLSIPSRELLHSDSYCIAELAWDLNLQADGIALSGRGWNLNIHLV